MKMYSTNISALYLKTLLVLSIVCSLSVFGSTARLENNAALKEAIDAELLHSYLIERLSSPELVNSAVNAIGVKLLQIFPNEMNDPEIFSEFYRYTHEQVRDEAFYKAVAGTIQRSLFAFPHLCVVAAQYTGEQRGECKELLGKKVSYLTADESRSHEVRIDNGLITQDGQPFDSGADAIFVVTPDLRIYTGKKNIGYFHHSSLRAAQEVLTAGHWEVKAGKIIAISNVSGHYRPSNASLKLFIRYLGLRGVDVRAVTYHKKCEGRIYSFDTNSLLSFLTQQREINFDVISQVLGLGVEKWDLQVQSQRAFLMGLILAGDSGALAKVVKPGSLVGMPLFDDHDGQINLLHFAAEHSAPIEIYQVLCAGGGDFNEADSYACLPLGIVLRSAASPYVMETVKAMVALGADLTLLHGKGKSSLLFLALCGDHIDAGRLLRNNRATVKIGEWVECELAEGLGSRGVFKNALLVGLASSLNAEQLVCGLKRAICELDVATVALFLENGADASHSTRGMSALQYAELFARSETGREIISLLRNHRLKPSSQAK